MENISQKSYHPLRNFIQTLKQMNVSVIESMIKNKYFVVLKHYMRKKLFLQFINYVTLFRM